ncbi:hypothetical protein AC579_5864 [Pseudocercospora musae]|uniref:Uncharacterized protein n=1 Tax=Pseudocercospora musae TaxID=113226 RepID=A0A139ILS6_9PEZI|nr:hypothetical protein AC579_5864 [Pseudocercospora musae]
MSDLTTAGLDEADENGGRDVGWTNTWDEECASEHDIGTKGPSVQGNGDENKDDTTYVFGTFYTWWREDMYGPRLFYRNDAGTTPDECAELMLVPRCISDASLAEAPINNLCYQGRLPA